MFIESILYAEHFYVQLYLSLLTVVGSVNYFYLQLA